jgi:hypothetical protein
MGAGWEAGIKPFYYHLCSDTKDNIDLGGMQPPDHISITMFEIQAVDSKYQ